MNKTRGINWFLACGSKKKHTVKREGNKYGGHRFEKDASNAAMLIRDKQVNGNWGARDRVYCDVTWVSMESSPTKAEEDFDHSPSENGVKNSSCPLNYEWNPENK